MDDTPPSTPVLLPRSADNIYPQRGIRPEPSYSDRNYWVHIEWLKNPEPDCAGYRVYRTGEWDTLPNGDLTGGQIVTDLRVGVTIQDTDTLVWIDHGETPSNLGANLCAPNPSDGKTRGYYWEIEAYDESLNISRRSSRHYYRLLSNPQNLQVIKQADSLYKLSWQYDPPPDAYVSYYMLRVFPEAIGPDSVMWYQQASVFGADNFIYLNNDGNARPFVSGTTYRWQLNVIADQPRLEHASGLAGAAVYTTFVYQN